MTSPSPQLGGDYIQGEAVSALVLGGERVEHAGGGGWGAGEGGQRHWHGCWTREDGHQRQGKGNMSTRALQGKTDLSLI